MGLAFNHAVSTEAPCYDDLIAAAKEAIAEDGDSQASFARKCSDVSRSTFGLWLNKNYNGDVQTVSDKVSAALRERDRRIVMRTDAPKKVGFVETHSAKDILGLLARAHHTPTIVTLTGEPGVGKTFAAREYKRRYANVTLLTATKSQSRAASILAALGEALQIHEGLPWRRAALIRTRLRQTGGLIIIDEAQYLDMDAADELRAFHDDPDIQVGIAFLGNPDVRRRLSAGGPKGKYAQITSRIGQHFTLRTPKPADILSILDEERITDDDARKLLRAVALKGGALREMGFVLLAAREIAGERGEAVITAAHIEAADKQRSTDIGGGA